MKVLQVIDSLKIGGAQRLMSVFAQEMLRGGHETEIISLSTAETESPIYRDLKERDIPVSNIPLRTLYDRRAYCQLREALAESRADVVHTQLNYANILGTTAARRAGIPSVASLHNASVHLRTYKPYRTWLETIVLRRHSRRIIACGYTVARVQQPRFGKRALEVVPNPVPDLPEVPASTIRALRAEFLPGGKGILVISVGRLIPEKGYPDLIQAFRLAREQCDLPMRLLIAGKGYLLDDLRAQAAAIHQQDAIFFAGERDDVPALLAASDIYAGASHYEGQSLAVLEAMLSGLAVVATDVGDNRQVIQEACGRVLPAGRIDLFADEIARLAKDAGERKRLGENARRCVNARYSPAAWLAQLMEIYREVQHE